MAPRNEAFSLMSLPSPLESTLKFWHLENLMTQDSHVFTIGSYNWWYIVSSNWGFARTVGKEFLVETGDVFSVMYDHEIEYGPHPGENWSFYYILKAGFTVFSLANNHTRDFGDKAFLETMRFIREAGAAFVGGGANQTEAAELLRLKLGSLRLSIFAAALEQPCSATDATPGANPLNAAGLAAAIANERSHSDFILAVIHDGKEHIPFPSRRVRENYRAFVDAGAGAVSGHHPHIIQGIEYYHGGLIAYSLGNFHFPACNKEEAPGFWNRAFSLRLYIGQSRIAAIDVLPHHNDSATDRIDLMTGTDKVSFLDELSRLNRILENDVLCDRYYHGAALQFAPYYFTRFEDAFRQFRERDCSSEARLNMFYCFQCLNNAEHWDVLQSATDVLSSETAFAEPDDLNYLRKD